MKKQENRLGDLLGSALNRAGIMKQVGAAVVVQAGNDSLVKMLDEGILQYAQCRSYEGSELTIACVHAAVAQEIKMRQNELVNLITEQVPGADVQDVLIVHRPNAGRGAAWYDDTYAAS